MQHNKAQGVFTVVLVSVCSIMGIRSLTMVTGTIRIRIMRMTVNMGVRKRREVDEYAYTFIYAHVKL